MLRRGWVLPYWLFALGFGLLDTVAPALAQNAIDPGQQQVAAPGQVIDAGIAPSLAPNVPPPADRVATAPAVSPGTPMTPRITLTAAPPFVLTATEQAEVDALLNAWEKSSAEVKTFKCNFARLEYDSVFGPEGKAKTDCSGELKFAAPDKGLFHVTEIRNYNPMTGEYIVAKGQFGEHWVCDGKSIFEFDHAQKKLVERELPPEMQGKAISEGPLPFVFGAKADDLRKRYYIKIVPFAEGQILLDIYPKLRNDAANYSKIELILLQDGLMPYAIKIYDPRPGSKNFTVYTFDVKNGLMNRIWDMFARDFSRPALPSGYEYKKYTAAEMRIGGPLPEGTPLPQPRQAQLDVPPAQIPPQ